MKTRTWLPALLALGLSSCGSLPARDVKPATDLAVMRDGVRELTRERQPQAKVTRAEDVTTVGEAGSLLIALEDTNWLQNDDKRRLWRFVDRATRRIELALEPPCPWYSISCRIDQAARRRELAPEAAASED